ncbi:MAG: galactose mutarotase [Eubacterium sp.]|nr:galactose mutarotase [Eubacterium sp.]
MIQKEEFGKLGSQETTSLYTIRSAALTAQITDFGATPVSLFVNRQDGSAPVDVVLGYDTAAGYEADDAYLSALIGRFAARIEDGHFFLNGKEYRTDVNEGKNTLHSGFHGYHKRLWRADEQTMSESQITFTLHSDDGDQGFPGNVELSVTYSVNDTGDFRIYYRGVCDQDTPLNLTNHIYWNLNGQGVGDILGHRVRISADSFTPVRGADCIPTGEILPVQGTVFDFSDWREIGERIDAKEDQVSWTGGYDHNYCLSADRGHGSQGQLTTALEACGDRSGIQMTARTSLPGFLFYTGNNLTPRSGKRSAEYRRRSGFCVETQYYPNCVNEPDFPSCILHAGEIYEAETVFSFK